MAEINTLHCSKSFDLVDRIKLLSKLNVAGCWGNDYSGFASYLYIRRQKVTISETSTEEKLVEYGVVQGSMLAPALLLIYINSIAILKLNGMLYLFADNTARSKNKLKS